LERVGEGGGRLRRRVREEATENEGVGEETPEAAFGEVRLWMLG
jgi:hypothetical protein